MPTQNPAGVKPVTLEIDGKPVTVDSGATVMDAATRLGIYVPHFCYHKKLSIAANCRMCLVQVEKVPKPLPACATPAAEGMKVFTHSENAIQAQKGVMEFLLINHPLDCPICDQGGECQLQDLAVGYGKSTSRYEEAKRSVVNKNLGPLIATDMTRCIHCTRCVRFGQEIGGVMELGMAGRSEFAEILAFVGRTVDSELSGNMIDVCPVGALTSKPFRYSARNWELARRRSVSAHDSLGSTLMVQSKLDRVLRVLPIETEAVNECWISDRDRFAYEGLNSEERLLYPAVKRAGEWAEVDWPEALEAAARGLEDVVARHGAAALGLLFAPHLTLEELHLGARLARGLGTGNIDHRIRQADFRARAAGAPWLGMSIAALERLESVLVVGSTLRKEQPLLAARLRAGAKRGLAVNVLHVAADDWLMPIAGRVLARPGDLAASLAAVAAAVAQAKGQRVRGNLERAVTDAERAIAASLLGKPGASSGEAQPAAVPAPTRAILLGHYAQQHPDFAVLLAIAQEIGRLTGATVGVLPDGANAVGACLAGVLPRDGLDARSMIAAPRRGEPAPAARRCRRRARRGRAGRRAPAGDGREAGHESRGAEDGSIHDAGPPIVVTAMHVIRLEARRLARDVRRALPDTHRRSSQLRPQLRRRRPRCRRSGEGCEAVLAGHCRPATTHRCGVVLEEDRARSCAVSTRRLERPCGRPRLIVARWGGRHNRRCSAAPRGGVCVTSSVATLTQVERGANVYRATAAASRAAFPRTAPRTMPAIGRGWVTISLHRRQHRCGVRIMRRVDAESRWRLRTATGTTRST